MNQPTNHIGNQINHFSKLDRLGGRPRWESRDETAVRRRPGLQARPLRGTRGATPPTYCMVTSSGKKRLRYHVPVLWRTGMPRRRLNHQFLFLVLNHQFLSLKEIIIALLYERRPSHRPLPAHWVGSLGWTASQRLGPGGRRSIRHSKKSFKIS